MSVPQTKSCPHEQNITCDVADRTPLEIDVRSRLVGTFEEGGGNFAAFGKGGKVEIEERKLSTLNVRQATTNSQCKGFHENDVE